jgi:hypothetical protein
MAETRANPNRTFERDTEGRDLTDGCLYQANGPGSWEEKVGEGTDA